MTIGILFAFLRDLTDRTVKNTEFITDMLDLPLLGTITDVVPQNMKLGTKGMKSITRLRRYGIVRMILFNRKKKERLANQSVRQGVALITDYDASGRISEEYRTIQTNISFSKADGTLKTIAVTSDSPAEGKSTVSANLAVTFANQEQKTILVDLDMRKPTVHATFGIQNSSGLVNLLTDSVKNLEMLLPNY
ncbi:tyrosine-protein kinase [Lacticaseibacillus casei UW4]|nr:tyrosine-protein kinase [Lacticaseibacillus casei UW4]